MPDQEAFGRLVLDAFGDDLQPQRVGHPDHRPYQRGRSPGFVELAQEHLVDLQLVHRKLAQVGEGGVARPEIVDRLSDAHAAKFEGGAHQELRLIGERRLGEFDHHPVGGDAAAGEQLREHRQRLRIDQVTRREVHRAAQVEPLVAQLRGRREEPAQHQFAQRLDQPRLLGERNEVAGGHHRAVRTDPARKRLCAGELAGAQAELRLEPDI